MSLGTIIQRDDTPLIIDPTSKAMRVYVPDDLDGFKLRGVYSACRTDQAGVAAATVYFTLFNPIWSGVLVEIMRADYMAYAVAQATAKVSVRLSYITAHSAGTAFSVASVARHRSTYPPPGAELRHTSVTVTQMADIKSMPPAPVLEAVPTACYNAREVDLNPWSSSRLYLAPGVGLCFYSSASNDVDYTYDLHFLWAEHEEM